MHDFAYFIHHSKCADPAINTLRRTAHDKASEWPYYSNDISDYVEFVTTHAPEAERSQVLVLLGQLFETWRREQEDHARPRGIWHWITNNPGTAGLFGLGVVLALGIIWALATSSFLEELAAESKARGLITFLVAISTVAVALLTAISIFYLAEPELESRYSKAKDLLAILVGILGTILGFYFGSIDNPDVARPETTAEASAASDAGTGENARSEP
jgi:hypothetical protein